MAKVFDHSLLTFLLLSSFKLLCANQTSDSFPRDFLFGVGTSSYQIEGAWNADNKSESIWDYLTHNFKEKIVDQTNGDYSAESYKHWKRDVEMVRELGVDVYRFSISWPRILPSGFVNNVNEVAVDHYNSIINELLKRNITPALTMYHWDLPQRLQELGGWTNAEIVDLFVDYANVLLERFGDRVKFWTTINEPWHICEQGYGQDYMAPSFDYPGIPTYLCGHNVLKANAKVYRLYKSKFAHQNGTMGITLDISTPHPLTHSHEDHQAAERTYQFYLGWFAHPIFSKNGNYPKVMIDRIGELSRLQGFSKSRLPSFTPEEIRMIHRSSDFFGINSYTSVLVTTNDDQVNPGNHKIPSFQHDMGVVESQDESWEKSGSVWLRVHAPGMRHLLNWIRREYDNPILYVTENGVSDNGELNDVKRVEYFNSYLTAVLQAMKDGCNVKGYIAWSLMDSYEWKAGFSEKFGLYHVDFESRDKIRTPKMSAFVYRKIIRTRRIDVNFMPYIKSEKSSGDVLKSSLYVVLFAAFLRNLFL